MLKLKQIEQIAKTDLEWYFNFSSADCGLKSNYNSMINVSLFGVSSNYNNPFNTKILNSVAQQRVIEQIFYSLEKQNQLYLYASFGDIVFSKAVIAIFNKFTGCAHLSKILDYKKLISLCHRVVSLKESTKDRELLSAIRNEAQTNYYESVTKYYEGLKKNREK